MPSELISFRLPADLLARMQAGWPVYLEMNPDLANPNMSDFIRASIAYYSNYLIAARHIRLAAERAVLQCKPRKNRKLSGK